MSILVVHDYLLQAQDHLTDIPVLHEITACILHNHKMQKA